MNVGQELETPTLRPNPTRRVFARLETYFVSLSKTDLNLEFLKIA